MNPQVWVEEYGDALYRYALSRVKDPDLAEDLVQETLLAAIGARSSFKGGASEQTWLIGILRHKTLDHFRKSARERPLEDFELDALSTDEPFDEFGNWISPPEDWSEPERALERDEFWTQLNGCLNELPDSARLCFVLREFDGLGTEEVASTLSITRNNLWVLLSRARSRLRACLQKRWFSGGGSE